MKHVTLATKDRSQEIATLLERSIREICEKDYPGMPEAIDQWCANKTPRYVEHWIDDPKSTVFVCQSDGDDRIEGVSLIRITGDIELCYTLPEAQGTGIGVALLEAMTQHARDSGLTELTLNSTISAHEFYRKHGFRDLGDVTHGTIRCFAMEKEIDS